MSLHITYDAFKKESELLLSDAYDVMWAKMADYTQDANNSAIDNFVRNAKNLGVEPRAIWAIYFLKHVDALLKWVREGHVASESLRGRFVDVINYAQLGHGIWLAEQRKEG